MPRRAKGPRLWLRPARRDSSGQVTHAAAYFILDSGRQIGIGCSELIEAEQKLAAYIAEKYRRISDTTTRDPSEIPLADVIRLYALDVAPNHASAKGIKGCLNRLLSFFGDKTLSQINGAVCRTYLRASSTDSMARLDLEYLRAAINHHRKEGLHDKIISVVLPPKRPPRERSLERAEAAKLLWAAWRGKSKKQVARFVLIGLYTGRRTSVICQSSFKREAGRPWIDTRSGYLWPPERAKKTRKRNPPIPLPERLLIHLRAWERNGARYPIQWGDNPTLTVYGALRRLAANIGLGHVTPHVMRHTAATWMMQAGVDLWEAAGYLGMTVRTLESVYGHHRPTHLENAKNYRQKRLANQAVNRINIVDKNRSPNHATKT